MCKISMTTMQKACASLMKNGGKSGRGSYNRDGMTVSAIHNGKEYSQHLTWEEINAAFGRALANSRRNGSSVQ